MPSTLSSWWIQLLRDISALFDNETGAVHDLPRDAVVILSSNGSPDYEPGIRMRAVLDKKCNRSDVRLVDAPVLGGTIRAAAGTLIILAAGVDEAITAAKPVLGAMAGKNLHIFPGGLGAGTKVKMVHQVLAGIHIVMTSEVMGFAAAEGPNTREVFEVLKGGVAESWMFENRVLHMLEKDSTIYSALNIIDKDVVNLVSVTFEDHELICL